MKTFMMLLVAGLALAFVVFAPAPAEAGRGGWRGGGHWHGGGWNRGWRGGPRYGYRGYRGYGYRGWRGYGWGWGGVWAPGVGIYVGPRRCWQPGWGYVPCRYRYGY